MFSIGMVTVYMICKKEKLMIKQNEVMEILRHQNEFREKIEQNHLLSGKNQTLGKSIEVQLPKIHPNSDKSTS